MLRISCRFSCPSTEKPCNEREHRPEHRPWEGTIRTELTAYLSFLREA